MASAVLSRLRRLAGRLEQMVRRPKAAAALADAPVVLRIFVSDSRWQATLVGLDVPGSRGRQSLPDKGQGHPPELVREALASFGDADLRRVEAVHLMIEDEACVLLDNRTSGFPKADAESLARFAAQQFALKKATFGHVPFGASSDLEVERRLFGFIDAQRASEYLYALGDLGARDVVLAPLGTFLLKRLAEDRDEPFCIVSVNGGSAVVLAANPESGTVVHRVVPYGLETLVGALVEACGVPRQEILATLGRRNYLTGVPARAGDPAGPLARTLSAEALAPVLHAWRDQLAETLDFFAYQRLGGSVREVFLHGDSASIKGLDSWLAEALGRPVGVLDDAILGGPVESGERPFLNLLEGGFRRSPTGARTDRAAARRGSRLPRLAVPEALGSLMAAVKARLPEGGLIFRDRRPLALLAVPLPVLAFLVHHQAVRASEQKIEQLFIQYEQLVHNQSRAIKQLRQNAEAAKQRSRSGPSPVSDAAVGLAELLPGRLWLQSIQVTKAAEGPAKGEPAPRLVMDGFVSGADPDPTAPLSAYVETLAASEPVVRIFPQTEVSSLVLERAAKDGSAFRFRITGKP